MLFKRPIISKLISNCYQNIFLKLSKPITLLNYVALTTELNTFNPLLGIKIADQEKEAKMSDIIQPIVPISRVEPVYPVSSLKDTGLGLYQIFVIQLAFFLQTTQEHHSLPPAPFFPVRPLFPPLFIYE